MNMPELLMELQTILARCQSRLLVVACREGCSLADPAFLGLCFFCRPEDPRDVALLVAGLQGLLAAPPSQVARGTGAAGQGTGMGVLLLRAKRVASLCMRALLHHSSTQAQSAADSMQPGQAASTAPQLPEAAVATIELLTGGPHSSSPAALGSHQHVQCAYAHALLIATA